MPSTLIILASLVIFPFLTYYATSSLFFQKISGKSAAKEPPTIPYFIPGLFHAASFAILGARKYFAEVIKDYGTFSPFTVKAGPRSYVVLRDPVHIRRVLDAPEHLSALPAKVETSEKLFVFPKAASRSALSGASGSEDASLHLSDTDLTSITDAYVSILSSSMHDKMFQVDSWTGIEDFWSFLQLVLLRCTVDTLFGSALLKKYPRLVRDYLQFDVAIEAFIPGMPSMMLIGSTTPRDGLHQGIGSWLKANQSKVHDVEGAVWDKARGSLSIRKHCEAHQPAGDEDLTAKARAAEILSIIHTTNNELASSTFWFIVETLRKSHLSRSMITSVDQCYSPKTSKHDVLELAQVPLVRSIQAEVRRLRTATCVTRTNQTDGFPLDKHWSLPKGATVAMFSHDVALNTDAWKQRHPRALERPLEEFWAERFATLEQKTRRKKDVAVGSATESLEDLIKDLTDCERFPEARLISALQMATVAVLFAEFEVQLSDTEDADAILPLIREFAYGRVKPREKIAVRIRKRKV